MSLATPTRLVICVDGTWFGPDGRDYASNGNISNIFRIWATVEEGLVTDGQGRQFNQIKKYHHGIGVGAKPAKRWNDGIYGAGCPTQIKDIYQHCCKTLTGPDDELWLYGFSRGAYVVRAVAGLFHHLKILKFQNRDDSNKKYDDAVDQLFTIMKNGVKGHEGQLYRHLVSDVRGPLNISFVGVFDTVKAHNDQQLFDISFTDSMDHLRHAVSLNENRFNFPVELLYPPNIPQMPGRQRSMIQAWFLGAHRDLGGGARHDGLSLYPLQWILIESKRCGLSLKFHQVHFHTKLIQNPLEVVFPGSDTYLPEKEGHSGHIAGSGEVAEMWHFAYQNGIHVEMQDLRPTHSHPRLRTRNKLLTTQPSNSRKSVLGIWDAMVYVEKDDDVSMTDLLRITLDCLENEPVRQRCVAAEICDVNPKVDTAIARTHRLC